MELLVILFLYKLYAHINIFKSDKFIHFLIKQPCENVNEKAEMCS